MKKYLFYLFAILFYSCEKNDSEFNVINLKESDLMITEISYPNYTAAIYYYLIGYKENQVDYINFNANHSTNIDSTKFYYTNSVLDSAITYSYHDDTIKMSFNWKDTLINSILKYSKHYKKVLSEIYFTYQNEKLIKISSNLLNDSIIYNSDGQIVRTILMAKQNESQSFSLEYTDNITKYFDFYNPYFLISKRLGYPFFIVNGSPFYFEICDLIKYCYSNNAYSFSLDDKRRVIGITNNNPPIFTHGIKYK